MPRLRDRDPAQAPVVMPEVPFLEYQVQRREDVWFIAFEGDDFGPYGSSREALLFAIDVAHKLGERGRDTRVRQMDSTGQPCLIWTYGIDAFPPRL